MTFQATTQERADLLRAFAEAHPQGLSFSWRTSKGQWKEMVAGVFVVGSAGELFIQRLGSSSLTPFPQQAWEYAFFRCMDDDGNIVAALDAPPSSRAASPQAANPNRDQDGHEVSRSEEQRLVLLNEQRAASTAGELQRSELMTFMQRASADAAEERRLAREEAATQRKIMHDQQLAAEAKAESQRLAMQNAANVAAAKAEQQRLELLNTLRQFSGGKQLPQQAQAGVPVRRKSAYRDDDEDDDDAGAATDVDDEDSCLAAVEEWRLRCRACPKQAKHLCAWFASSQRAEEFQGRWARKLDPCTGVRDVIEATSLLSIIADLQRGLAAPTPNVAMYAVTKALNESFLMASRLQMRAEGASFEAISEFDVLAAATERKVRRRPTDFLHHEQLITAATRKHPKKAPAHDRSTSQRRRGGRGRGHEDFSWQRGPDQWSQPAPAAAPSAFAPPFVPRGGGPPPARGRW